MRSTPPPAAAVLKAELTAPSAPAAPPPVTPDERAALLEHACSQLQESCPGLDHLWIKGQPECLRGHAGRGNTPVTASVGRSELQKALLQCGREIAPAVEYSHDVNVAGSIIHAVDYSVRGNDQLAIKVNSKLRQLRDPTATIGHRF